MSEQDENVATWRFLSRQAEFRVLIPFFEHIKAMDLQARLRPEMFLNRVVISVFPRIKDRTHAVELRVVPSGIFVAGFDRATGLAIERLYSSAASGMSFFCESLDYLVEMDILRNEPGPLS